MTKIVNVPLRVGNVGNDPSKGPLRGPSEGNVPNVPERSERSMAEAVLISNPPRAGGSFKRAVR
jgi:hypothetical protein